jgi:F-box interacting protein
MVTMPNLSNLPEDVLESILVRLPAGSVARCRAVCRAWRSAVSRPSLDRVHAQRPAVVAKVTVATAEVGRTETTVAFDFFHGRWHRDKTLPSPRTLRFTSCDYPSCITVLGSWDGIVCIQRRIYKPTPPGPGYRHFDQYTLWNPLTMACADASAPTSSGEIVGAYAHPSTRRFQLLHASSETVGDLPIAPTAVRILGVGDSMIWRELPLGLQEEILMNTRDARHFVSLHGNLHWLVLSGPASTLRVLAFDTTREKFRSLEAPKRQRGRGRADLTTARLRALSGDKLCIFDLELSTSAMDVWVLDDYDAVPQSWQLKERISLVTWDKSDLSRTFSKVKVVQSVYDGEEIFFHKEDGRIYTFNLVEKEWLTAKWANVSKSSYSTSVSLVMHRESVLPGEVSFGEALSPALSPMFHRSGQQSYSLQQFRKH